MRAIAATAICAALLILVSVHASRAESTAVQNVARRMGLELRFAQKSNDLDYPGAIVEIPSLPHVRLEADIDEDSSEEEARANLAEARDSLEAFARARWVLAQIMSSDKGRARIYVISVLGPRQPDFRREALYGLRYRGLNHAAACFERDRLRYYDVDIWLPHRSQPSWWLLLENGDLVLNQGGPGETLPMGAILRADGTVESPSSSLPC